jgi:hypothetical protein
VLGERAARLRHVAFKVKSRWLEHTLSRETVVRDQNYERAMGLVLAAVEGPLRAALVDRLEAVAASPIWDAAVADEHRRLLEFAMADAGALAETKYRRLCRTVSGRALTPAEVAEICDRDGRLLIAESPTPLSAVLEAHGSPVFLGFRVGGGLDPAARFLAEARFAGLGGLEATTASRDLVRADTHLLATPDAFFSVGVEPRPPPELAALLSATAALLAHIGAPFRSIATGMITSDADRPPRFVIAPEIAAIMSRPHPAARFPHPTAVLDRDDPHLRALARIEARAPGLGAHCLARLLARAGHTEHPQAIARLDAALAGSRGR